MKKNYYESPSIEIVEIELENAVLAMSNVEDFEEGFTLGNN